MARFTKPNVNNLTIWITLTILSLIIKRLSLGTVTDLDKGFEIVLDKNGNIDVISISKAATANLNLNTMKTDILSLSIPQKDRTFDQLGPTVIIIGAHLLPSVAKIVESHLNPLDYRPVFKRHLERKNYPRRLVLGQRLFDNYKTKCDLLSNPLIQTDENLQRFADHIKSQIAEIEIDLKELALEEDKQADEMNSELHRNAFAILAGMSFLLFILNAFYKNRLEELQQKADTADKIFTEFKQQLKDDIKLINDNTRAHEMAIKSKKAPIYQYHFIEIPHYETLPFYPAQENSFSPVQWASIGAIGVLLLAWAFLKATLGSSQGDGASGSQTPAERELERQKKREDSIKEEEASEKRKKEAREGRDAREAERDRNNEQGSPDKDNNSN